jgi:tetratricopeptide (TPR) repeat protein
MKPNLYLPLFVIFFQLIMAAGAQTPVLFSSSEQQTFVVHLQPGNDPAHQASNYIIRELARINNKRPDRTEYSFTFDVDVQLTRRGNRLVTRVDMEKIRFRGDYRYMGFDMSDVLLPWVDFKLELRQRGMLVTTFEQKATALDVKNNRFSFEYVDSLPNDNHLRMAFSELNLHITHINRRGFDSKIALITDYFNTDALLHDLYAMLQSIDVYQLEYIHVHRRQLQDVQMGLNRIHSRDFINHLQLFEYDPISMIVKMNNIMALQQDIANELDWVQENLHVLYYERGLEQMGYDTQSAISSFRESLRIMPEFAPAMLEMAKLLFRTEEDHFNAMIMVQRAWQLPYIDPETRRGLQEFSQQMSAHLQNLATDYERAGDFSQALVSWTNLQEFCASARIANCSNLAGEGISRAHRGLYDDMIRMASRSLSRGELEQAEREIRQAMGYQRAQSDHIRNNQEAQAVLQQIKIQQHRRLIDDGRSHLARQSYGMALKSFEDALAIERDYPVFRNNDLPDLIKQSKRPLLMAELNRLNGALQRNELQQARSILNAAEGDIRTYDFVADQEIAALMETYREQLRGQYCANIQAQMDALMHRADQHIMEGSFLATDESFNEIVRLNNENRDCGLSLTSMERRRAEVLPAITYQQRITAVDEHIRTRRYAQAVDHYNDAGRYFEHNGLQKFRLEHRPLEEFSKAYHPDFVLHVANMFANMGEAHTALNLIYHLESLGFAPRQMRNAQEVTGRVLAREDAAENPDWKPRQKVREYTHGNRSLRFMRRAYVKQFRRSR